MRSTCDANGNRTARVSASGAESCAYDVQDRVLGCGDAVYAHNVVGQLASKTVTGTGAATSFDYDVFGNLRAATLPDGRHVEYENDAQNRRIGKKINGVRQWGLLYQTELAPIAQVDDHNRAVSVFVYATKKHVPDYMRKDGVVYRLVSDHLGSVRMVVNVADGRVAQRLDYDEFGVVLSDTNPGFQPFGFAGGIYDPDTGLTRFGARDYDAVTGRWTAKDPILFDGGTSNLYQYVNGDVANRTDARGKGPDLCALAVAVCIGLGIADVYGFWQSIDACMNAAVDTEPDIQMCPRDPEHMGSGQKQQKAFNHTLAQCSRTAAATAGLTFASAWGCLKAVPNFCLAPTP